MKKGKVFLTIFLILLIGCIAGAGVYAYLTLDYFRSDKQLFGKYFLLNNFEQIKNIKISPLDEFIKSENLDEINWNLELKPNEDAYSGFDSTSTDEDMDSEGSENSTNIKSDNNENEDSTVDNEVDNTVKVTLSSKTNKNNEAMGILNASAGETDLFNLTYVLSKDIFGIRVPILHEKYIAVENRDLKKIGETFEVPAESMEKIPNKIDFSSFSEEDKSKVELIKEKYFKITSELLSDDKFSSEKNVTVDVEGNSVTANKYSLTITAKESYNIVKTLINDLSKDEEFISLFKDYNIKESMKELVDSVNNVTDEELEKYTETILISAYVKDGRTVKSEASYDNTTISFCINNSSASETNVVLVCDVQKSEDDEYGVASKATYSLTNKCEDNKGTLKISSKVEYNKDDVKKLENNEDAFYSFSSYEDSKGEITLTTTKNDENTAVTKISLGEDTFNGMVTINKNEILFKKDSNPKIDKLTTDNAIIINDYTQEEFGKLGEEISGNIAKSVEENPTSLLGLISSGLSNGMFSSSTNSSTDFNDISDDDSSNDTEIIPDEEKTTTDEEKTANEETKLTLDDIISNSSSVDSTTNDSSSTSDGQSNKDPKDVCKEITTATNLSLVKCLSEYKQALTDNDSADLSEYLSIENIRDNCSNTKMEDIELLDGSTLKCKYEGNAYYMIVDVNADTLQVTNVESYTEEDYSKLER